MLNYGKMTSYPIFKGFSAKDIECFVAASSVRVSAFGRGDILLREGDECRKMGIIIEGSCTGETFSESGRREITAYLGEGSVFGDVLAMSERGISPVTVTALTEVSVMYIPFEKLLSGQCLNSAALLKNLAAIISDKYFGLLFRVNCLSKPTLREKILFYLHEMRLEYGAATFSIPFDRSALADFLSADRSALSRELSRLKKEGVIDYYKNTFILRDNKTKNKLL
ncbi:MAG: Crp/Fnr family transcriptional regulator [Eubacteriales bacterium]|nr:Crp/Fnr family transcriptional regulator [Eubacteriales bacterium]